MASTSLYDMDQLRQAAEAAACAAAELRELPDVALTELDKDSTALIIVDMIRGFTVEGPLSSPRLQTKAAPIARLAERCLAAGIPVVAFADSHSPDSPEFGSFPPHCLAGSSESELCEELAGIDGILRIDKGSTNGFLEPAFAAWRQANAARSTYIVVGGCTDICVRHFAATAKAAFNAENRASRILVPAALCETFDGEGHPAAFAHLTALLSMQADGAELCGRMV